MATSYSKQELSLLLYLESRAVDHSGKIDQIQMNSEERTTAEKWRDSEFIAYGRIPSCELGDGGAQVGRNYTYWVILSPEAWAVAAKARMDRAFRNCEDVRGYHKDWLARRGKS